MSSKLSDLPNIGKELERLLSGIGINTYDQLKETGPVEICRILKLSGEMCYSKLYALEGAIRGIRWHNLTIEEREKLKKEFLTAVHNV